MPTYSTPEPISIELEIEVGSARVVAEEREDTVVEIRPRDPSRRADVEAAEKTQVDYAAGRLTVRTPHNRRVIGPGKRSGSVDVDVSVPAGSALSARGSLAAFRATGVLGVCSVKTSMGDVDLERAAALELRTGFGAIRVDRVDGDAEVTNGSGDIRLGAVLGAAVVKNHNGGTTIGTVAGDLRVKAANGSISVACAGADVTAHSAHGDVRVDGVSRGYANLKTAMGEIEVGVAAGSAARLDVHTSFGRVRSMLDEVGSPAKDADCVAVDARTGMGDIVVRRAAPVASG